MNSRTVAGLIALFLLTSSAAAFQDASAFRIEYPLEHYRLDAGPPDKNRNVRNFEIIRQRLTRSIAADFVDTRDHGSATSVVTGLPLSRAVRPIRTLWHDPLYMFRPPLTVEWIELVDERGRVTRIWVTASNQSREKDEKIIGWCTNDALWRPVEAEGRNSAVLRSAGVTLVGSPWHYRFWLDQLHTAKGAAVAIVLAGFLFWLVARVAGFRRDQRLRHEQLMERLHRTTPYKAPSVDDD